MMMGMYAQQAMMNAMASFPSSGLTSYWRLDESSGATATDQQGVNNAAIDGSPTWSTDFKLGSHAIDFTTGTSPRMRTGIQLGSGNTFTIGCWVKRAGANDNRIIVSRQRFTGNLNDRRYWYIIHRNDRGGLCLQYDNVPAGTATPAVFLDAGQALTINTYELVGMSYNSSTNTAQIWINAVKKVESVLAEPFPGTPGFEATTAELMFGNRISNYSSLACDGKIDEPFIFNRILTQDDWDRIYAAGAGIQY